MSIRSVMEILSRDSVYKDYTLVSFITEGDECSGKTVRHLYRESSGVGYTAQPDSAEQINNLRDRVSEDLRGKDNVILVDENKAKIFTDIKGDEFFLRLVDTSSFSLTPLGTEQNLKEIIKRVIPDPIPSRVINDAPCIIL